MKFELPDELRSKLERAAHLRWVDTQGDPVDIGAYQPFTFRHENRTLNFGQNNSFGLVSEICQSKQIKYDKKPAS
jgi:hypothetical protein